MHTLKFQEVFISVVVLLYLLWFRIAVLAVGSLVVGYITLKVAFSGILISGNDLSFWLKKFIHILRYI